MKKIDSEIKYAFNTRERVEMLCPLCGKIVLMGYFTFIEMENEMKFIKHKCNKV